MAKLGKGLLEGKVAIVTGSGQGIGRGIALAFAKEGARVTVSDINPKTCEAVTEEIRQLGKESLGLVCNTGDNDQVKKMVEKVVAKFGSVDILVNNAMGGKPPKPVEELDDIDWDLPFQSGTKGTWYCCRAVFPYMKGRGGKIINIASAMGIMGLPGTAAGAAAKEGIRAFTRVAAREWGAYKINLNVICPFALTPAYEEFKTKWPGEMDKQIEALPLRRIGDPENDIGRAAVFLASADSDFMTGQTLNVDGGSVML